MSDLMTSLFDKYLPARAQSFIEVWGQGCRVSIKTTRQRQTKLGDYRRLPDGQHRITINHDLPPDLFFFVLTHEFAHLLAFKKFGFKIAPHGQEWKHIYRQMLLESQNIYSPEILPLIRQFSRNPKANFSAFSPLAKVLESSHQQEEVTFVETIPPGTNFLYRRNIYRMLGRRKINYLCEDQATGRRFSFRPATPVKMITK